jgi:hypothetical protein
MTAEPKSADDDARAEAERLERATDEAIAARGGDPRATVRALIVALEFAEREVSHGFRRGVRHGSFNTYSG